LVIKGEWRKFHEKEITWSTRRESEAKKCRKVHIGRVGRLSSGQDFLPGIVIMSPLQEKGRELPYVCTSARFMTGSKAYEHYGMEGIQVFIVT
jgi:hypothetical protein